MRYQFTVIFLMYTTIFLFAQANTFIHRNYYYYENLCFTIDSQKNSIVLKAQPNGNLYVAKYDESGLFVKKSNTFSGVKPKFDRIATLSNGEIIVVLEQTYSTKPIMYIFDQNLLLSDSLELPQLESYNLLRITSSGNSIAFLSYDQNNEYFLGIKTAADTLDWFINIHGFYTSSRNTAIGFTPSGNIFVAHSGNLMALYTPEGDELWTGDYKFNSLSSASDEYFYYHEANKLFKVSFNTGVVWFKEFDNSQSRYVARLQNDFVFIGESGSQKTKFIIFDPDGAEYRTETIDKITGDYYCKSYDNSIFALNSYNFLKFDRDALFKGVYYWLTLRTVNPGASVIIYPFVFNVGAINLYYSNDMQNWEVIGSGLLPDEDGIKWKAPDIPGKYYLKIQDYDNPEIATISDLHLTVNYYPVTEYIHANNVFMWAGANGMGSHNPLSDDSGLFWDDQGDESLFTVFADGPVFGFVRDDSARVYASTYRYGFTPGIINEDASYTQPGDSSFFIYKAAKDWGNLPSGEDKFKFEYAQNNWPAEFGAPFMDNNYNGTYEPDIDEPDVEGDQMMWWTNHTADSATSTFAYGSYGDKLEIHTSVWGSEEPFQDVVYKRYKFINKSEKTFNDFYFGYWADPDVGNSTDDYAGFDTLLNLGYCYNGEENDDDYYLNIPASVGYLLLDGPITEGTINDTARFDRELRTGYKNLPMTASHFYIGGSDMYSDPDLSVYDGTKQLYNQLIGKLWSGEPIIEPVSGDTTQFVLSGQPETESGWFEGGTGWLGGPNFGDRRILISSGPFTMEPGDTNMVILAIVNARASGRINSLVKMKRLARQVRNEWLYGIITDVEEENNSIPERFTIGQNYPNPFNPCTVIEFSLPKQSNVKLEVFNILGEKVADLVNTELQAGVHKVDFNGEGLASGLYIYRLTAGDVNLVRKMMLLK